MAGTGDWNKIVAGISDKQVLALEQAAIRIPSTTFEEGKIADLFANYMSDLGLDVEMMEVTHWAKPGQKTRQPIGRLKGTGGGPSLMLNGHMDPGVEMSGWSVDPYGAKFEDGWVWGMGAHDDKGGVVAAICAAPTVLKDAALLDGRRFTAHFSVHGELPGVIADERVIVDGRIVTSRGAGTALDFGLALVEQLFGKDKAQEVAASIMA